MCAVCPSTFRHLACTVLLLLVAGSDSSAQQRPSKPSPERSVRSPQELTVSQWKQLDQTVDNGLKFLATQQGSDGSFPTLPHAKPGVTGLCVLAFLSRGHLPNEGPYGRHVQQGIEFILSIQRQDGLFTIQQVEPTLTSHGVSHAGLYNHGIAGLMLGEVYGMNEGQQNKSIRRAIENGLAFSSSKQAKVSRPGAMAGGFDYLVPSQNHDGLDLPITSCQLLFYRSARNAGFEVPADDIQSAMRYVRSCYEPGSQTFTYRNQRTFSRGLTGCGILALSLGGEHETDMARDAGDWILTQSFHPFNVSRSGHDRYFYSAYYCSQAMFQLGGEHWNRFYLPLLETFSKNQRADGSWEREMAGDTERYGNSYSSALAILALTPPYQLLPIYQR